VERFWKTLKLWQRLTLFAWKTEWIQRKLDAFRDWYNTERPMWCVGGRTPEETWAGKCLPETVPFRATDPIEPVFLVARHHALGDPRLPVIEIQLTRRRLKRAA
jgi:hypothetical protein